MKVNALTTKDKKKIQQGRYIRSRLVFFNLNQAEIARQLGVSTALVSMVIHGKKEGVARNGQKINRIKTEIAKLLGKPVDTLFINKTQLIIQDSFEYIRK